MHLYSTFHGLSPTKGTLHVTCNFPAQALSTVSFLYEGEHLLPSQLPGEHTGHKAASRCSEPIWNAHIPPITLIAGTHFTYSGRDGRLSQPVECSTTRPSHVSHYGAMPAGWSPIHVLTRLMIA